MVVVVVAMLRRMVVLRGKSECSKWGRGCGRGCGYRGGCCRVASDDGFVR